MNGLNNKMMNTSDPKALIVDMSWVNDHNTQSNNLLLLNKVSVSKLVTAIAAQPSYYHDSDSVLWGEIENMISDDKLDNLDINSIELLISVLKEEFYNKVDNAFPNLTNNYVFSQWIDNASMCLIREDLVDY